MPELPEVETVRRGLEPVLVGQTLKSVIQRRPNLRFPFPDDFAKRLTGQTVTSLQRRAKYLLAHLSGGEVLVMHLGMSGRFTIEEPPTTAPKNRSGKAAQNAANKKAAKKPAKNRREQQQRAEDKVTPGQFVNGAASADHAKHDHVVFETASGARVTYNDARRFGFMLLIHEEDLPHHKMFAQLGPEPLGNELHGAYLANAARGRKCDLKAFLMDQKNIAGLGNIYVCEALYRARLSPDRKASTLATKTGKPLARTEQLVGTIRDVLNEAIAAGGSTLRDYKKTDGSLGYFQHRFAVYGREGEPCSSPRCSGGITRKVHAGRSTFYCPKCQK